MPTSQGGNATDTIDATLASCFRLYNRHKLRGRSPKTRIRYEVALRQFDRFLGRPATIADLTDDQILDAMHGLSESRRWEAGSANKFRSCLLALWRFLARKRIVEEFPDVEKFPEPKRIPIAWTRGELRRLWQTCESQTGYIGEIPANRWWHGLHAVAWDSAERIGAVMQLEWENVSEASGFAVFRAETRKGGREDKACILHRDTIALLSSIRTGDPRVFPWPYSKTYLWNRYERLLKKAGLPHGRNAKFHRLRKSSASYFAAAGGNATELLGHSDPRVTAVYLDPRIVGGMQAAEVLFRPEAG